MLSFLAFCCVNLLAFLFFFRATIIMVNKDVNKNKLHSRTVDCLTVFTCVSYAEARNSYRLDVCLSVRPSVTRWYCIKTVEHIVMLSSPHDSPFILVLCVTIREIPTGSPPAGAPNRGGV